MNNQKGTITIQTLKRFKKHSKHFTTKVIDNNDYATKQQIRCDTLNEVLEVSKEARNGYAIWVWIKGMNPLQLTDENNNNL